MEIGAGIASYSVAFCLFGFLPLLVSGDTGTLFMGILGLFFVAYGVFRLLKKSQYYPTAR